MYEIEPRLNISCIAIGNRTFLYKYFENMTHKGTPSRSFNFLTRKRRVSLWEVALAGALLSSSRALGFVIDLASVAIPSTSTLRQSQKQVIHNNHALKCSQRSRSCLFMTSLETSGQDDDRPLSKKEKQGKTNGNATSTNSVDNATLATTLISSKPFVDLEARIRQLEQIVSRQEVQIQKLRKECNDLTDAAVAFARMVDLFRQAGLENMAPNTSLNISNTIQVAKNLENKPGIDQRVENCTETIADINYEYFDDSEIFGRAPSSVIDAADAAGAAILAGMLGGKQRMLVDVRDAELSRDPETLVQFVELAILPVAAGLEGLRTARNRVKIVFPTVSQLLQYRRTMALAAPEVVALSTLGFDPIEKQDQLVVLIAPSPDDEEGLAAMNELLVPTDGITEQISQPLVVINHHMLPLSGPAKNFEVAYHLRLLSVHYMSGENKADYLEAYERHKRMLQEETGDDVADLDADSEDDDEALEAAMKHAHEIGMNQGVTRAMVIRAYPK